MRRLAGTFVLILAMPLLLGATLTIDTPTAADDVIKGTGPYSYGGMENVSEIYFTTSFTYNGQTQTNRIKATLQIAPNWTWEANVYVGTRKTASHTRPN